MSMLYVTDNGSSVGISGGNVVITYPDSHKDLIPKETVESVAIYGRSQVTTPMIQYCLMNGVDVSFFSQSGSYYGSLQPADNDNVFRQKKQFSLTEDEEFCLTFAKKMLSTKINNQITILRRMNYSDRKFDAYLCEMCRYRTKINECGSISQMMGYEGRASRIYFAIIASEIDESFSFAGRTRPAEDPINALLNMGYSMLYKELVGELTKHGLNPYAGFIHKDKMHHAALASDIMEEWRPIIVDSCILNLVKEQAVTNEGFFYEDGECRMNAETVRLLISRIEDKLHAKVKYITSIGRELTFREAIGYQCSLLAKCIDNSDVVLYETVRIR